MRRVAPGNALLELEKEASTLKRLTVFAVVLFVVLFLGSLPSPYVIERPGPVVNTLGDIQVADEVQPVIDLQGVETYPTSGALNLLAVTVIGSPDHPTSWLSLLPPALDSKQDILPTESVFPPGTTSAERATFNTQLMGSSQTLAAVAALGQLGEEVDGDLIVVDVAEDGPAAGILEPEDAVLGANSQSVRSVEELREVVASVSPGEQLELDIVRGDDRLSVSVTPESNGPGEPPLLSVLFSVNYELPFEVRMSVEDIGGPSAGMIFALAMYDQLTEDDLTEGLNISGTGTIDTTGRVGQIGGLTQKLWGASAAGSELFLMPLANCTDVPDRLPKNMKIAPVDTLDEAVQAIEITRQGDEPAGLERCTSGSH